MTNKPGAPDDAAYLAFMQDAERIRAADAAREVHDDIVDNTLEPVQAYDDAGQRRERAAYEQRAKLIERIERRLEAPALRDRTHCRVSEIVDDCVPDNNPVRRAEYFRAFELALKAGLFNGGKRQRSQLFCADAASQSFMRLTKDSLAIYLGDAADKDTIAAAARELNMDPAEYRARMLERLTGRTWMPRRFIGRWLAAYNLSPRPFRLEDPTAATSTEQPESAPTEATQSLSFRNPDAFEQTEDSKACDPRWHLGQCMVWIDTHDLAAVGRVAAGSCIAAAIRGEKINTQRAWRDLVTALRGGRIRATGIPAGELRRRPIEPWEFDDLDYAYSRGSEVPYLVKRHGVRSDAFRHVRVFCDDLMDAFSAPAAYRVKDAISEDTGGITTADKEYDERPGEIFAKPEALNHEDERRVDHGEQGADRVPERRQSAAVVPDASRVEAAPPQPCWRIKDGGKLTRGEALVFETIKELWPDSDYTGIAPNKRIESAMLKKAGSKHCPSLSLIKEAKRKIYFGLPK